MFLSLSFALAPAPAACVWHLQEEQLLAKAASTATAAAAVTVNPVQVWSLFGPVRPINQNAKRLSVCCSTASVRTEEQQDSSSLAARLFDSEI